MLSRSGAAVVALLAAGTAVAATPEEACQAGRFTAAGKYVACMQKAVAKFETELFVPPQIHQKFYDKTAKCREKYADAWEKLSLQAAGTSSTCDAPRFVDNGDGTVTDNLTELSWEKKGNADNVQNLGDPHDNDNLYTWSADAPFVDPDGTAFASFLTTLNGACFAGQCDWRLPTKEEALTVVDVASAVFGTTSGQYWAATTYEAALTGNVAWCPDFTFAYLPSCAKTGSTLKVRAVRGGL